MGYVSLTVTAVVLSTIGIPWSIPALSLPPLAASTLLWITWRGEVRSTEGRRPLRLSPSVAVLSISAGALGFLLLVRALVAAEATSTDFLLFWGVKTVRFAQARSIDATLLKWPYFAHAVPDYPPAVPAVLGWSVLWTRELSWRAVPLTTALWPLAAAPLLFQLLRRKDAMTQGDDPAAAVTAFWLAAVCISLARSLSGGSAEAPLLFFETLAVAALLRESAEDDEEDPSRFLPALMLAGAALTKVEGSVAVLLIAAGTLGRDVASRRGAARAIRGTARLLVGPVAALATWFLFQASHGLPAGFRTHGELWSLHPRFLPEILSGLLRNLDAGTLGLSWLIPLVLLALLIPSGGRRADGRALLPGLTLAAGILAFLVFDYLHDDRSPSQRIGWTAPRVSQPALSAVILAAGFATSKRSDRVGG
jgi:hypothetical protein